MLLDGPDVHLTDSDGKEQMGRPGQGEDADCQPRQSLEKVVGARHPVESIAARNFADSGTRGAEVSQGDMSVVVGELCKGEKSNAAVDKSVAPLCSGRANGIPGAVDPVSEVES